MSEGSGGSVFFRPSQHRLCPMVSENPRGLGSHKSYLFFNNHKRVGPRMRFSYRIRPIRLPENVEVRGVPCFVWSHRACAHSKIIKGRVTSASASPTRPQRILSACPKPTCVHQSAAAASNFAQACSTAPSRSRSGVPWALAQWFSTCARPPTALICPPS